MVGDVVLDGRRPGGVPVLRLVLLRRLVSNQTFYLEISHNSNPINLYVTIN